MTSPTRDEARLREVKQAMLDAWDTEPFDAPVRRSAIHLAGKAADALLAAGLVVPEDLTAEKLLLIADCIGREVVPRDFDIVALRSTVRAWADALGVPETKTETL